MKKLVFAILVCVVAFGLKAIGCDDDWTTGSSVVVMKGKIVETFDWSGSDNLKDKRDIYFVTHFNAAGKAVDSFAFEVGVPHEGGKPVAKAGARARLTDGEFWPADVSPDDKSTVVYVGIEGFDADGEGWAEGYALAKTKNGQFSSVSGTVSGSHSSCGDFVGGLEAKVKARYDKKASEAVAGALSEGDDFEKVARVALDEYLGGSKKYPGVTHVAVNWSNAGGNVNEGVPYTLTVDVGGNEDVIVGLGSCGGLFSFDPITATVPAGLGSVVFTATAGLVDSDTTASLFVDVNELPNGDWIPVFGTQYITQTIVDLAE